MAKQTHCSRINPAAANADTVKTNLRPLKQASQFGVDAQQLSNQQQQVPADLAALQNMNPNVEARRFHPDAAQVSFDCLACY